MKSTLRYLLLFVFTAFSGSTFAQELLGHVVDSKKEPVVNGSVSLKSGGIVKGITVTDFDGNYSIKGMEPGSYDVTFSYVGCETKTVTGVFISPGGQTQLNQTLEPAGHTNLKEVIVRYEKPLTTPYGGGNVLTGKEIKQKPTTQTADLVAQSPGIYQQKRNGTVNADGGRSDGNLYIIDGVQVYGSRGIDMSQGSTDALEVLTSGISAQYGDVSGAVINITSKGGAAKTTGGIRLQHSIDGYNNNLASFSLSGPLAKKLMPDGSRRPFISYALGGDYYHDADRYPYYDKQYIATGDVLKNLQKNPLKLTSDNSGNTVYNLASDYITANQLTAVKRPPNNLVQEVRLNGKMDFKVNDQMRIVAGGSYDYTSTDQYNRARIYASSETPVQNQGVGRGYLRFTQKFGKQGGSTDSGKHSLVSNAFYTVQLDYQQTHIVTQDPTFKSNIFDYAYVGKFTTNYTPVYIPNITDTASGKKGTVLFVTQPTGINFQRSEMNPNLANYTTQYYNSLHDNLPTLTQQIQASNALLNGDEPALTYGLAYSPGASQSYYQNFTTSQYALTVDASFDLKTGNISHGIQFGLYYQQRVEKSFTSIANTNGYGTSSLWGLMRQLVSSIDNSNLVLDKAHPVFHVNGQTYSLADVQAGHVIPSPTDTISYNYVNVGNTPFDKNLRKQLGLSSNQNINIDALDPSTFNLGLFSADELLNSGNPFVNYYGYSYTGAANTGTVNFNDYWTQKDANGNYTRPIGAFTPNYIAGYLLDKFKYKDILFNIGVRVDRYSANTKVLTDPYSLYQERTVGDVGGSSNYINGGKTPANIGNGYVVYVDDNNSKSPNIIGYRSGNNWYDATGKFISDPSVLKNYSGGRDPQPLLANGVKITDSNFNPNGSFTDYVPDVTVMPRIRVAFPISASSNFFAHYDLYAQRPTPNIARSTPYDYYYLNQNSNTVIENSNLKTQKTYDYELGFQQEISKNSALTITGFYKERKDQITVQPYLYAYPTTYYTYGNRDFSTTKGVKLNFDTRATNHLTMNINYTLQFAEGTGSTPFSTNSGGQGYISPNGLLQTFIEAGLPNLRYVSALDYDSRHIINGSFDYRYEDGEGPVVKGKHIFQNAGIDLIAKARSGEPFTRLQNPIGNTIIGDINGSRLPWHYGLDLRINKDFAFEFGKTKKETPDGVKAKRIKKISAFIYVNNLLSTREILGVYGYTGRPDDNGYLSSSYGKQFVPQQINPQSYSDLYRILYNDPSHFNYARTITFGLEYNF